MVWVGKSTLGEVKREAAVQCDRFLKLDKKQQLLKARQNAWNRPNTDKLQKLKYIYFLRIYISRILRFNCHVVTERN